MRRALLPWLVALGLAVLGGIGAVVALNATVFGAGGFVTVYLDALARGDVADALTLPGVDAGAASPALLHDGTTTGLRDVHQTGEEVRGDVHLVTVDWTSPHGSGSTTFQVQRIGTRFGLFPAWGFAVSPTATIALTAFHDPRFTMNGEQEVSGSRSAEPVDYAVLVPGSYVFGHTSRYLTAQPDTVLADTVSQNLTAVVDARANTAFVGAVDAVVQRQLTSCATQTVLFPTGCPFGQSIDNRVSSTPAWSIVVPPPISIVPGTAFGTWAIPATPGTAHLRVQVTSLLNGSTSDFDQDVPFQVQADIALGADDAISVTLR